MQNYKTVILLQLYIPTGSCNGVSCS